jgi:hypothetical protein
MKTRYKEIKSFCTHEIYVCPADDEPEKIKCVVGNFVELGNDLFWELEAVGRLGELSHMVLLLREGVRG